MLGEKYTQYILNKGKLVNKEIKNNIYASDKVLIKLLLVDYVLETLRKYDARNCPDYKDEVHIPIVLESSVEFLTITEDEEAYLTTEHDEVFASEDDPINPTQQVLITEDIENYIATEGDYNKYLFDQSYIENFLMNLTKDIQC